MSPSAAPPRAALPGARASGPLVLCGPARLRSWAAVVGRRRAAGVLALPHPHSPGDRDRPSSRSGACSAPTRRGGRGADRRRGACPTGPAGRAGSAGDLGRSSTAPPRGPPGAEPHLFKQQGFFHAEVINDKPPRFRDILMRGSDAEGRPTTHSLQDPSSTPSTGQGPQSGHRPAGKACGDHTEGNSVRRGREATAGGHGGCRAP